MKGIRNMTATDNLDGAISVKEFCKRNSIGVTSAYAEIADGKLIALHRAGTKEISTWKK